ncbi:hypothetical protein CASFOL_005021 [Castilleja foliolosa]|uniref:Uncharacterized protein n=1 Tax=Castilleja foliolosa TaxID=1961234 RepID=A0ABD3E2L0_9LAMI
MMVLGVAAIGSGQLEFSSWRKVVGWWRLHDRLDWRIGFSSLYPLKQKRGGNLSTRPADGEGDSSYETRWVRLQSHLMKDGSEFRKEGGVGARLDVFHAVPKHGQLPFNKNMCDDYICF